jgi:hypothetical protein
MHNAIIFEPENNTSALIAEQLNVVAQYFAMAIALILKGFEE